MSGFEAGLAEDRDVRVGILPHFEERFVFRCGTGFVAVGAACACDPEMRKRDVG